MEVLEPQSQLKNEEGASKESVHLQLQERWSTDSDEKKENLQASSKDKSSANPSNSASSNSILIGELRNVDTNDLLLAIHGWNQTKAHIFGQHIYGDNYSQLLDTSIYREVIILIFMASTLIIFFYFRREK